MTDDERIVAIADAVRRYLEDHPRAADTVEGVRDWWVARQRYEDSLPDVERALDHLIEMGLVARRPLTDGTILYFRVDGR